MKTSLLIKWALIGASLPLLAGCVEREVVYRDRPAPGPAPVVDEAPAPPPPQAEVITVAPGPLSLWFWAPGCWEWHGRWVWTRPLDWPSASGRRVGGGALGPPRRPPRVGPWWLALKFSR